MRLMFMCLFVLTCGSMLAQSIESPGIPLIHAHNDYAQTLPFWNAWSNQCASIEADLLWSQDKVYVAHDEDDLLMAKDLKTHYLDPIRQVLGAQQGKIYTDTTLTLYLLLDIKNARDTILPMVISWCSEYPDIFNEHSGVSIVLSGERPSPATWLDLPSYIKIDARITDTITHAQWAKVAMISMSFGQVARWNGKGRLDQDQQKNMDRVLEKVRSLNVPLRFWGTPDSPSSWQMLIKNGVDWIGTDRVDQLTEFIRKYPKHYFHNNVRESIYQPQFVKHDTLTSNVILLIADGMGFAQVAAAYTANHNQLTLMQLPISGWVTTHSADSYCTDSAAGASAYATGHKTSNRMLAVDRDGSSHPTLMELCSDKNMMTAIISSVNIADATPAAFYAHVAERDMTGSILRFLSSSDVNLIAGEGVELYELHEWLKDSLRQNDIHVADYLDPIPTQYDQVIRLAPSDTYRAGPDSPSRHRFAALLDSTLNYLTRKAENGFFLVAESGRVDVGGHHNDLSEIVNEVLSLDRAVAVGAKYVDQHPETLLIILADHETGGLSLLDGDPMSGWVLGQFSTDDHTGIPIPYWAYGAGADAMGAVLDNTDIFNIITAALQSK